MFKIFRSIRRRLLDENKTSKYFQYAIGEVVLIVIGIMIALQISSWSEQKHRLELERNFLQRFITDLSDDLAYFEGEIENAKVGLEAVKEAVALINRENVEEDFYRYNTLYDIAYLYGFNPQFSTYEELESTGQLSLIRDNGLRLAIQKHYAGYDRMTLEFDHLFVWRKNVTYGYDAETSNLKYTTWNKEIFPPETRSERDWEFMNDPDHPEFKKTETALAATSFWITWHMGDYEKLIPQTEALKNRIVEALEAM